MNHPITVSLPTEAAVELGEFRAFIEEERRNRIPPSAVWTAVVTIAISAISAVWLASATYHEVATLRATVDKWEPKIEEITKLGSLREQLAAQQVELRELRLQLDSLQPALRPRAAPRAAQ